MAIQMNNYLCIDFDKVENIKIIVNGREILINKDKLLKFLLQFFEVR